MYLRRLRKHWNSAAAVLIVGLALTAVAHTPSATKAGAANPPAAKTVPAYWLVASDGGIFSFGGAQFYGSTGNITLNKPIVGMASTHNGLGYWLVASDGGIFSYGDAQFYGSTGNITLNQPIVGMAATPDGNGYWLVAADGGIFSFGDAKFYGSTGNITLNQPIVGMAATPDGNGYWLVAADGGIFSFGDAQFYGSTGNIILNKPIIGMVAASNGGGYFLVASDGGTFSFGAAPYDGSLGGVPLKNPIAAVAATPGDTGYWFSDTVGSVTAFGQASYYGSAPAPLNRPIVGMAEAPGTGAFVGASYPSGSYGYDVSKYQMNWNASPPCTSGLPAGDHDISIVEVDGGVDPDPGSGNSVDYPNPCLAVEGSWAGGGLNLYTFLDNVGPASGLLCSTSSDCYSIGYNAGIHAFNDATTAGLNTGVTWWLDVEGAKSYWSTSTADNAETVMGAIAALHNTEGVADVGIYASPANWNGIVGDYQPSVPYWMADYVSDPSGPGSCADYANWNAKEQLPSGPLEVVQYNSADGEDDDYAC